MATLGLEEADSKMHVQRTGSGYEAVQTDVGAKIPNVQYSYRSLRRRSDGQAGKTSYLGRSDWMPLATGFARSSDVKLEVSRGHSRGNLKGRTLTTRVEVTALMTNSSGPQNNVQEGGCHDAKRAEQRSVVYGKRRSS